MSVYCRLQKIVRMNEWSLPKAKAEDESHLGRFWGEAGRGLCCCHPSLRPSVHGRLWSRDFLPTLCRRKCILPDTWWWLEMWIRSRRLLDSVCIHFLDWRPSSPQGTRRAWGLPGFSKDNRGEKLGHWVFFFSRINNGRCKKWQKVPRLGESFFLSFQSPELSLAMEPLS